MKKLFIPFEESFALKKLGFNEECLAYYHNHVEYSFVDEIDRGNLTNNSKQCLYSTDCACPLYQQVFNWFRDKHNIDAWSQPYVNINFNDDYFLPDETYSYFIFKDGLLVKDSADFIDFDEAQLECLREVINYLNKNL